ncbi:chaperone protein DnaJ [Aspergillus awamori]|uniref:Chaperone protein DnaJ n=1 Tax=Aspergillus awamori TaxID=105351 RepID=A0A401L9Z0_ASPAW|nr:chaperone protein DnaJ [Aspergillus awamori]
MSQSNTPALPATDVRTRTDYYEDDHSETTDIATSSSDNPNSSKAPRGQNTSNRPDNAAHTEEGSKDDVKAHNANALSLPVSSDKAPHSSSDAKHVPSVTPKVQQISSPPTDNARPTESPLQTDKLQQKRSKEIQRILDGEENDYERILGISGSRDKTAIQKAFKKKALLVHPDKNNGGRKARTAFMMLVEASENILDKDQCTELNISASWHPSAYDDDGDSSASDDDEPDAETKSPEKEIRKANAPDEVKAIYQEATPHVLKLFEHAKDEAAQKGLSEAEGKLSQYYENHPDLAQSSGRLTILSSYLIQLAKEREALETEIKAGDEKALKVYQQYQLSLADTARAFDWPESWRLPDQSPECSREILHKLADDHIQKLKKQPGDEEALKALQRLNSWVGEYENKNGTMDSIIIDIEKLRSSYSAMQNWLPSLEQDPNNTEARRKVETVNDEIKVQCTKNHYPDTWSYDIPGPHNPQPSSSPPRIRSRDNELICGIQKIGNGYRVAVLENDKIPIGELRAGAKVGHDSVDSYMASEGRIEMTRLERDPDNGRKYKVLAVFEHKGPKHITWVGVKDTSNPEQSKPHLVTLTNYRDIRRGVDADYDVRDLYRKYRRPAPNHISKNLAGYSKSTVPQAAEPKQQADKPPLQLDDRAAPDDTGAAMVEELLNSLRNEVRMNTKLSEQAKEIQALRAQLNRFNMA